MSTLVLAGGNEFRQNCVAMDREILKAIPGQKPRVVVVPTANRAHPDLAAAHGVGHFERLGAAATAVNVVDRSSANDPQHADALREADLVYFAGGDPWFLLDTLRDTLFLKTIRETYDAGRVIAGSSAGAMVFAEQMVTTDWSGWILSLAFAGGVGVVPHHEHAEAPRIRRLRDAARGKLNILGIDEATACVGDGSGTWWVVGVGKVAVYRGDQVDRYAHGDTFSVG